MSRVWRQASRQVSRPKAYLEAGVKQGEAVEIAAKQIYVYNIENLSRPRLSKLQQNSFGRSRLCELGAKQAIFQDEPGGRLQSRLRGSLEAIEIATKQKM